MSAVSNGAEVGTARHATSRVKEEFYLKRFRPLTATAGSGGGTAVTTAPEPEKSGANTPAGSRGSLTCAPEAQAPGKDSGADRTTVNSRLMTASCRSGGSGMERPSSAVLSAASCPVPVRRESPNTPQHKPPRPPRHDSTLVSFDSRPQKSTECYFGAMAERCNSEPGVAYSTYLPIFSVLECHQSRNHALL